MASPTKYRLLALITFLSIDAMGSFAQGVDIRGIVSDSVTGQRIPSVNVVILNSTAGRGHKQHWVLSDPESATGRV